MRLRILTMNVQNDAGDARRIGLLNQGLRAICPDVVARQEVAYPAGPSQLDALLEGTGLRGTHQADVLAYAPPFADQYGGTAVASRWPHRVVEVLDPRMADAPDVPWCTLASSIPLPDAGELLFIATTWSWRLAAASARERQAVAGDGPGFTWSADNEATRGEMAQIVRQPGHRRRLDCILVGSWDAHPTAHCRVVAAELAFTEPVGGIWASDHFGVIADVEIGEGP